MRKLYSLFAAVILAVSVNAQTTVTYTFSGANGDVINGGTIDPNLSFVTGTGTSAQLPTYYVAAPAAVRIYSDRATGDGNFLKISVATGYEITGLTFTGTTTAFSPAVTYSVDGGASAAMPLTGAVYNVTGLSAATSLTFKNAHTGGSANTQLRIPSFTVTYKVKSTMAVSNANTSKVNLVKNTVVGNSVVFATKADVQVINMNGQVVRTASVNENTSLDVTTLPKGTYIVTGIINGKTVSQKLIK